MSQSEQNTSFCQSADGYINSHLVNSLPDMPYLGSSFLQQIKIRCLKYEQMGIQLSD